MSLESEQSRKDLLAAQEAIGNLTKDRTAKMGGYSYQYIGLDTVLEAVKPKLSEHNFLLLEPCGLGCVTTLLIHIPTGDLLQSQVALPDGLTSQELGSAITYARRYSLCALLALAVEEDDDGQRASPRASKSSAGSGRPPSGGSSSTAALRRLKGELDKVFGEGGLYDKEDGSLTDASSKKLAVLEATFGETSWKALEAMPEEKFTQLEKDNFPGALETVKARGQAASSTTDGSPPVVVEQGEVF